MSDCANGGRGTWDGVPRHKPIEITPPSMAPMPRFDGTDVLHVDALVPEAAVAVAKEVVVSGHRFVRPAEKGEDGDKAGRRRGKPVRRSDGERYESAYAAARALIEETGCGRVGTIASGITEVANRKPHKKTAYGYGWEWVGE